MHNDLNLAMQYHVAGQLDQAAQLYQNILTCEPGNADALHLLGVVDLQNARFEHGIERINQAIAYNPRCAAYYGNLAQAYRNLKRLDRAEECCRTALRLQPDFPDAANTLGLILQDQGFLDGAADQFRAALRRQPDLALAHNNLGNVLRMRRERVQAAFHFQEAIRLDPNLASAHANLGQLYLEDSRLADALEHCRAAVCLQPELPEAQCSLGDVLLALRRFAEAAPCFRAALHHDSQCVAAHIGLTRLERGALPDRDLQSLQDLLARSPNLSPRQRTAFAFLLAQTLDQRKAYDQAARMFQFANDISLANWGPRGQSFSTAAHAEFVTHMIATCTPEFFQRVRGQGLGTERPVFIFGLPRSGTTLVEQILASHSQVFGAGELSFARDDFLSLSAVGGYTEIDTDSMGFRSLPEVGNSEDAAAFAGMRRLGGAAVASVARRHLDRLDGLNFSAARITNKMPDNYQYLGLLAALFPRARFIHCRRNLRDVAVSCWTTDFEDLPWASTTEHIAVRIHEYNRLMAHWFQVLPVSILNVDYEETVSDLEAAARRLVAWCGLHWEPKCLAFHETSRPVRTASAQQVRQPIYSTSVGRWKNYENTLSHLFAALER